MNRKVIISICVCVGIILLMIISGYNGLITKKEEVDSAFADLDVMLQRRVDLIPNLINTVKGYSNYEKDVIEKVNESRERYTKANSIQEKSDANKEITSSLNSFMAVAESYPDLKASANFVQLSDELAGTENRIATARRDYNNAVKKFNSGVIRFPNNILAKIFGMEKATYFEADEKAAEVPSVDFE